MSRKSGRAGRRITHNAEISVGSKLKDDVSGEAQDAREIRERCYRFFSRHPKAELGLSNNPHDHIDASRGHLDDSASDSPSSVPL